MLEIRLVSKDGKSKGIAYIEFKTEVDGEKTLEDKQGTEKWAILFLVLYQRERSRSRV